MAEAGAGVVGTEKGSVITVEADDVSISHLEVRGSGRDLSKDDAGILVLGNQAYIAHVHERENLHGIYVRYGKGARLLSNDIVGLAASGEPLNLVGAHDDSHDHAGHDAPPRAQSLMGNGVHLFDADGAPLSLDIGLSPHLAPRFAGALVRAAAANTPSDGNRVERRFIRSLLETQARFVARTRSMRLWGPGWPGQYRPDPHRIHGMTSIECTPAAAASSRFSAARAATSASSLARMGSSISLTIPSYSSTSAALWPWARAIAS